MARYIDADVLHIKMEDLYEHHIEMHNFSADGAVADCLDLLDNAPTAEVVEVKHGCWKEYYSATKFHYDCSCCDGGFTTEERCKTLPNYCSNCGAKMDGAKMSEMPTGSERVRVMICIDCPIRQYYAKMFDIHFDEKNCICKCPYRVIKERF